MADIDPIIGIDDLEFELPLGEMYIQNVMFRYQKGQDAEKDTINALLIEKTRKFSTKLIRDIERYHIPSLVEYYKSHRKDWIYDDIRMSYNPETSMMELVLLLDIYKYIVTTKLSTYNITSDVNDRVVRYFNKVRGVSAKLTSATSDHSLKWKITITFQADVVL